MKSLTIFITILSFVGATALTDRAYKEYKKKNYKKAFELYQKDGSPKAVYNMAVFYEKGLGVKKDNKKAKSLYKRYISLVQAEINDHSICTSPKLKYVKKSLKKLKRFKELNSLSSYCSKYYPTQKEQLRNFLRKCPIVKRVIKKRYWDEAKYYECILFKKFPKIMQRHLRDKERFKKYQKSFDTQNMEKLSNKAKSYVKPIMKLYKQRQLKCAKKAKSFGDLEKCSIDYILDMGEMIFEDFGPMIGDSYALAPEDIKKKIDRRRKTPLSAKDKKEAIKEIKMDIKEENYFVW
jgi:hypothetical protein